MRWLIAFLLLPAHGASPAPASPTGRQNLATFTREKSLLESGWTGGNERDGKRDHFLVTEGGETFLRSQYLPNTEAKYLSKEVDWDPKERPWLRWRWRVDIFPKGARVLDPRRSDAAAQVYLLWGGFPHFDVMKYFWATSVDEEGKVLHQNNLLGELYGLVLHGAGPSGVWRTETRNVPEDFQNFFKRPFPGKVKGIAVLSDGDDTHSEAEADFDDFQSYVERPQS